MPDLSASVSMSAEWGQQQPGPRLASAGLDDRQGKQPTRCLVHRVSCTLLPTVIKLASPKSNIYGSDSVISFKKTLSGNSMVVQRLGLGTFTAGTPV